MERHQTCSFFGHRKIDITEELKRNVKAVIEYLYFNHKVSIFLFGSKSDFDYLCHFIVSELKDKYTNIKRIAYTCKSESCILENERQKWEEIYSNIEKREIRSIIDDSDYCVFYYDENYQPKMRKRSKQSIGYYQPKSGTKLAYNYAIQKRKIIINLMQS